MTRYLIDKSALARATRPAVRERLAQIIGADDALTCPIVDLEMLYSARTAAEYELWRADRRVGYTNLPLTTEVGEQALAVQRVLAARGQHRGVSLPDLLIGTCASVHGATVLHYDADYEFIDSRTRGRRRSAPRRPVPSSDVVLAGREGPGTADRSGSGIPGAGGRPCSHSRGAAVAGQRITAGRDLAQCGHDSGPAGRGDRG